MILFAGIPQQYYDKVVTRAISRGLTFTGLPLRELGGRYAITLEYCSDLMDTLARYLEGRPGAVPSGVGVVVPIRTGQLENDFAQVTAHFCSFAVCVCVRVDYNLFEKGEALKKSSNDLADKLLPIAEKLNSKVSDLGVYYSSQVRRTPLLLPRAHFNSAKLNDTLNELGKALFESATPAKTAENVSDEFLKYFDRRRDGKGFIFENDYNVEFKTPPRNEFHGQAPELEKLGEHKLACSTLDLEWEDSIQVASTTTAVAERDRTQEILRTAMK
jgi:hypothetical protein